jgi:hypothetical protein
MKIIIQYYFVDLMEGSLECVFIIRDYHLIVSERKSLWMFLSLDYQLSWCEVLIIFFTFSALRW